MLHLSLHASLNVKKWLRKARGEQRNHSFLPHLSGLSKDSETLVRGRKLSLLVFKLLNIDNTLAVSLILAVCAPVGATATMFSEKFDGDTALSVELVSISTLFSMLTMPLITAVCQTIL